MPFKPARRRRTRARFWRGLPPSHVSLARARRWPGTRALRPTEFARLTRDMPRDDDQR